MNRVLPVIILALVLVAGALSVVAVAAEPPGGTTEAPVTVTVEQLVDGKTAVEWESAYARMRRIAYLRLNRIRNLALALRRDPETVEAIKLACSVYGVSCARIWWIATCEAGHPGVLPSPRAFNSLSDASGLGQFLPSTWRSTPFGAFNVFSPYANALAIAYMVKRGGSYVHWSASAACWGPRS